MAAPSGYSKRPSVFLLAEPDQALRSMVADFIANGCQAKVHTAINGAEGYQVLKQMGADFIVAGWDMPEVNGLGLLKVTRADPKFSAIPFVLMVYEITKVQVIEAAEAGVQSILVVPFSQDFFKNKIDEVLAMGQELDDQEVRGLIVKGEELMLTQRYNEALTCFQKILQVYENAEVYYNMGYIKTAQGKYDDALRCFAKATAINNAFAQAYEKMAECYLRLGNKLMAQASFQRAAEIYSEKKMDGNAEIVLKEVLKINPDTINVYNSLGILYRRQGRYDTAIRQYQKALRVNPLDENILYNLARTYYEMGEYRQSHAVLRKALDVNPKFAHGQDLMTAVNKALR